MHGIKVARIPKPFDIGVLRPFESFAAMALRQVRLLLLASLVGTVLALPGNIGGSHPTVTLDNATVIGQLNGTVVKYLGLPFAQPPYVYCLSLSIACVC